MGTPCNPSPEDGMEYAATIGVNPVTMQMYARCGCGETVLESGTQDEAAQALADHRALDPDAPTTPEEGHQ